MEQAENWEWLRRQAAAYGPGARHLNLFAYTGGSTLALARGGGQATHVDAARGVVAWARDNAREQGLEKAPVQWVVEDAGKFCQREVRRGRSYQGLVLDPPTFGRGPAGELWKIETDLPPLLELGRQLLATDRPAFVLLSCHSPGFTPLVLENLLVAVLGTPSRLESGEMVVPEEGGRPLPAGCCARWRRD
jgi:23S rRNA (cytosine1962-C5)-methyltransferase